MVSIKLAWSRVKGTEMGGKSKDLKDIGAFIRALMASETLEPGQKDTAVKAYKKIREGCQRDDPKLIKEGVAQLARTFLRNQ